MGANFDSRVLAWKKEIKNNRAAIRLIKEIKKDQVTEATNDIAPEEVSIDLQQPKLQSYSSYHEETGEQAVWFLEEAKKQNLHISWNSAFYLETVLSSLRSQKLPLKLVQAFTVD